MGKAKTGSLRKFLTSMDVWLAAMALGLISMLAVHLYLWKSMVALVKSPHSAGVASSENAIGALKAADSGGAFYKIVQAAKPAPNSPPIRPKVPPSPKNPVAELVARFDGFTLDPSRTEFSAKVAPYFTPGASPADHSLSFLLNLQLSNVAVPPDVDDLKAKAYGVITEYPAASLTATHRIVTLLDSTPEANAFREVLRKIIVRIGEQPEINSAEQRRQLGDIERFLSGTN